MLIDEWHHFVQQELGIALALGPHHRWMERTIRQIFFRTVLLRIIDAHDDQRRNLSITNQTIGSFIGLPVHPNVCRCGIKEILAIVEIKNGVVPRPIFGRPISRRYPDSQHARVAKDLALEFMQAQLSRQFQRVFSI